MHANLADSSLNVIKCVLVVMDIWKKNLFYLYGNTVSCGVSVNSHISDTNDDNSRLWQMRLAYACWQ